MDIETKKEIDSLKKRLKSLETEQVLSSKTMDPGASKFLLEFIALPFDTVIPTTTVKYGTQKLINVGGTYYIYAMTDAGWLKVKLT